MTVADYFIEFFIKNDVSDVFGYQGGMIAYLFDSLGRHRDKIKYHEFANEQGAALAACGFSQATGRVSVVLSTSGPGFTNMLTGIANAWFDSIPIVFISGQVNTKDKRRTLSVRQLGFQEIQSTEIAKSITKKTYEIDDDTDIRLCLVDAWNTMLSGRKGPVFMDLPINICRNEIESVVEKVSHPVDKEYFADQNDIEMILEKLSKAKKPLIVAGAGINQTNLREKFSSFVHKMGIPVVTTLPAVDLLSTEDKYKIGYLGGTGRRECGIALANADIILSMGTRLCAKQIGYDLELFAPRAKLIRIDVDHNEMERVIKDDEIQVNCSLESFFNELLNCGSYDHFTGEYNGWIKACNEMRLALQESDVTFGNKVFSKISTLLPDDAIITLDVGNNMVYGAQSSIIKDRTRLLVSGGLGAMGYSLPSAIGAFIGSNKPTYCFSGDGGMQMNIQEMNIIGKRKLPIKIIVLNNKALGHILLFQNAYLNSRLYATTEERGDYFSCDFVRIAQAYGIRGYKIHSLEEIEGLESVLIDKDPVLIEIEYEDCGMLPNIHGGHDCLTSPPFLQSNVINRIKELGFKELIV